MFQCIIIIIIIIQCRLVGVYVWIRKCLHEGSSLEIRAPGETDNWPAATHLWANLLLLFNRSLVHTPALNYLFSPKVWFKINDNNNIII